MIVAATEGRMLGRYRLVEHLGAGGMGEVWRAVMAGPEGFSKPAVVKIVRADRQSDPRFRRMLVDEARTTESLNHANIVQLYDLGVDGDLHYLAMEYVDGVTLRRVLAACQTRVRPVPVDAALFVAMEICAGLDYAHDRADENGRPLGIVHRDVSPENVMVTARGEVKILDFGIAAARLRQVLSVPGTVRGRFGYMSPEHFAGETVDRRADLFSAGAVLYEMLAGRGPFAADTEPAIARRNALQEIAPLADLRHDVDPEIQAIVAQALEPDRDRRFARARDLRAALEDYTLARGIRATRSRLGAFVEDTCGRAPAVEVRRLDSPLQRALDEGGSLSAALTVVAGPTLPGGGRQRWARRVGLALAALGVAGLATVLLLPSERTRASAVDRVALDRAAGDRSSGTRRPEPAPVAPASPAVSTAPVADLAPSDGDARARAARARPRVPPSAAPAAGEPGFLVVRVAPLGEVFVDGRPAPGALGERVELAPGRHHVRIENLRLGLEREVDVEVVSGRTVIVSGWR